MKKTILSFIILLIGNISFLKAQSGPNAAGGVASGPGGTSSYSIGLIDYIAVSDSGGNISQGLQQPVNCAGVIINSLLSNVSVCSGTDTGFTISNVSGSAPFIYQWQLSTNNGLSFTNITGPTSNHLSLNNLSISNNGYQYRCSVSNSCSSVQSNISTLTINPTPAANITPNSTTTLCGNANVVLIANLSSSYQWFKNNVLISSAIFQTYTATTAGLYSVQITNATGCTGSSTQIQVTKYPLPSAGITASGPTSFCAGDSVVLSSSTNAASPAYQWYKGSNQISGATNSAYAAKTTGNYKVQITNLLNGCSKTSTQVSVNIICKEGDDIITENQFEIFPNPTSSSINLSFISNSNSKGDIIIYNTLNEIVYHNSFNAIEGENNQVINLGNNPAGIYFVQLQMDSEIYNQKLIIE